LEIFWKPRIEPYQQIANLNAWAEVLYLRYRTSQLVFALNSVCTAVQKLSPGRAHASNGSFSWQYCKHQKHRELSIANVSVLAADVWMYVCQVLDALPSTTILV